MVAENQVEIRFRIEEEKAASNVAQGKSSAPVESAPQNLSQRERDTSRKLDKVVDEKSLWDRFESRIESRLRRIGARLIAANLVAEGSDILGIGDSFVSRLGQHAIQGAIMGGAVGAATYSTVAIVQQLAEIIKGHSEDLKKLHELQIQKEEELKNFVVQTHEDQRKRQDVLDEETRVELEKFRERVNDEILNVQRYVTVPYLGGRG